jgi:outer membrane protein assembly factor BamA
MSRRSHWRRFGALVLVACVASWTAIASGDDAAADAPLAPRRYELGAFPILAGSTDIGFQFGVAATLSRFYDQEFPYAWNVDLLLSASVKDDSLGFRLVQQSHVLRLDAPDFFSTGIRLDTRVSYQRTINAGYYGIGNAETAAPYTYEYLQQEGRIRSIGRIRTGAPRLDFAFAANLRYETPGTPAPGTPYANSKLAHDLAPNGPGAAPIAIGIQSALLGGLAAGMMFDTRDSEFVTTRGLFYQIGVGATVGSEEQVKYGEAAAVLAHYAPIKGPFSFASRFVASFQFGRVPFYDLAQGGVFEPQYLLGGETGVRGVPQGRYAGRIKMITNLEVRGTPFPRFTILGQRFRIGTTVFFDAGRVWSDYAVISPADGNTLGLKYGVGGGLFIQWGEAAIFRFEAAYSPDATSENPLVPIGIYVSDGLMF